MIHDNLCYKYNIYLFITIKINISFILYKKIIIRIGPNLHYFPSYNNIYKANFL